MIKVVSKIKDKRINAQNVLVEISVGEYIEIAREIIRKNEFQRKRVKGSQTVYSLLKRDMREGCTIPPIVVAVRSEEMSNFINSDSLTNEQIVGLFQANKLIILDGLQRTYTLLDLISELKAAGDEKVLERVMANLLRVEIFLGLNKIGILYRMLTLNTGQTPMSVRHQIEILYSDYHDQEFDGIKIFREIDSRNPTAIGQYKFNEVIEGFNAYLDRDALPLTRSDILENIKNLESLAQEDSPDLFKDYLSSYNKLVLKLDQMMPNWEATVEDVTDDASNFEKGNKLFGKNILQIFSRPQVLSGYGAAIGKLKELHKIVDFPQVKTLIDQLTFQGDPNDALNDLLKKLLSIQLNAKKIGSEQRYFFTYFFRELFNNDSDSFLKIDEALESGFNKYKSLV
jgi:hypothetical protein